MQQAAVVYKGYRDGYGPGFNQNDGPPVVLVSRGETTGPLADLAPGGPMGFTWGYAGAGPSNLARSILADYLGALPSDALTLAFRAQLIERLDQHSGWQITAAQVQACLARHDHLDWLWPAVGLELSPLERQADHVLKRRILDDRPP